MELRHEKPTCRTRIEKQSRILKPGQIFPARIRLENGRLLNRRSIETVYRGAIADRGSPGAKAVSRHSATRQRQSLYHLVEDLLCNKPASGLKRPYPRPRKGTVKRQLEPIRDYAGVDSKHVKPDFWLRRDTLGKPTQPFKKPTQV